MKSAANEFDGLTIIRFNVMRRSGLVATATRAEAAVYRLDESCVGTGSHRDIWSSATDEAVMQSKRGAGQDCDGMLDYTAFERHCSLHHGLGDVHATSMAKA